MAGKIIVGVDEAGRGPLAGPVYAACVILDPSKKIDGLNDSKKLTHKKREELYDKIIKNSFAYGIGYATHDEIDTINILNATILAAKRGLENIRTSSEHGINHFNTDHSDRYILNDGNIYFFKGIYPGEAVVKGDTKIEEIMAASILAKVSRDRFMLEASKDYPEYGFEKHKGYPTQSHYEAIRKYGASPIHRLTFKGVKQ